MEGVGGDRRKSKYESMVREFGIDKAKKVSSEEITFEPIAEILDMLESKGVIRDRAVFYDLGSGFGKPCLAAALSLPLKFGKCIGIEYLDGLY